MPQYQQQLDRLEQLKERIEEILPYVTLTNEAARREMLISPVILDLIHYTKCEVQIEHSIKVSEQLQGNLDYFIENRHNLLVIEAKREDLDYGFTQLMAELIAIHKWQGESNKNYLIGAVTTGRIWQFGKLNYARKHIQQGLDLYRVPDDLDPLMGILVQYLIA